MNMNSRWYKEADDASVALLTAVKRCVERSQEDDAVTDVYARAARDFAQAYKAIQD